jgi:hypothetical protein
MIAWESDTLSPKQREQFWRRVVEYETAPSTTHFQQLIATGLELPAPDVVSDEEVTSHLSALISGLARIQVYITNTDHLSDRELYEVLWRDVLRDEIPLLPEDPGGAWHIDLLGGGGEADIHLHLKYYADEALRRQWLADFPDYDLPPHENAPYDRDRHLPKPSDG